MRRSDGSAPGGPLVKLLALAGMRCSFGRRQVGADQVLVDLSQFDMVRIPVAFALIDFHFGFLDASSVTGLISLNCPEISHKLVDDYCPIKVNDTKICCMVLAIPAWGNLPPWCRAREAPLQMQALFASTHGILEPRRLLLAGTG